jgi:4-hydroxy-tetrahydrodipicolinate synthase
MLKNLPFKLDLTGVWTALVTPFERNRVNLNQLAELVRRAADAGLTGVVPLGSTGEASALEAVEQAGVIKCVVSTAQGKLKVMVGAGTNNTPKTIERVRQAADFGADAVLVVAPYYSKPTPAGLARHYLLVADASPLPIVLYHIPSRCGVGIPIELVLALARHPKIIGIKEAAGDVWRSGEIARRAPKSFKVLSGDDNLTLPLLSMGAVGVISVISNLAPLITRKMADAALSGDLKGALRLHQRMAPLLGALGLETNPGPIKEAMTLCKLRVGPVRPPLAPVEPLTRKALKQALTEIGDIE